jgi:hypothetical protein
MNYGIQVINGFLLSIGAILGALTMRLLFHIGLCG